jgi:hypothetical protein
VRFRIKYTLERELGCDNRTNTKAKDEESEDI